MLPQSRNTTVRAAMSSGGCWIRPIQREEAVLARQRQVVGETNITESLPSAISRPCIATSEPSASPSGFSWVASTKRGPRGSAAAPARAWPGRRSSALIAHARPRRSARRPAAPGRSCRRRGTRASACASGAARPRCGPAGSRARCAGPRACPRARAARGAAVGAEHAHVDARMAQVWACSDVGHGHESHTRVLQLSCDRIAEDLANRLVDPAHASRGHLMSQFLAEPGVPAVRSASRRSGGQLALHLAGLVGLQHVALLEVLEVREHDAALEAAGDLARRRR